LVVSLACSRAVADTCYQVGFSDQANFSWGSSGDLPMAPVGMATLGGVPFNIESNTAGNQAWAAAIAIRAANGGTDPGGVVSIGIPVNTYGATHVYTLINSFGGMAGPDAYAWLTFTGSSGANYTKLLVGNSDIRDYLAGTYTNSINGSTTINVFNGTTGTNYPGRLDMQDIQLPAAFATQTLTQITLVDNGGPNQRVVLDGVNIKASPLVSGDANLDGRVDVNDLTIVLSHYGHGGLAGNQGDFNGDLFVDVNDLTVVLTNYGRTSGTAIAMAPEPSTLAILLAAALGLLATVGWRRR
jgi:hypothetical protein